MALAANTREKIFLVGYPSHQITGCKLPSNRQVLSTLFFNLRIVKLNLKESARLVIREVLIFWEKARIQTKYEKDAIVKLEKLYNEWRNHQRNKNKTLESTKNKIKEFALKMDDLFDIAHRDALTITEKKRRIEEFRFDIDTEDDAETQGTEEEAQEEVYSQNSADWDRMDVSLSQATSEPSGSRKMRYSRGVKELLTLKLSMLLDRCKVSDRNASRIIIATIEALGQNPIDFVVSKSALHSRRKNFREKYTAEIRNRIQISENETLVVHWDGKLLPGVLKREQNERIAIAISYGEKEQLLGVPVIENSTGEEQAAAVYEMLEQWGVSNAVKAMCFDTTASNTGRLKGSCKILQQMLDKELLYLACRHHILEVLLRGIFDCKLGSTTGPQPDIFKRFQNEWSKIDSKIYHTGISDKNVNKHLTPEVITQISGELKEKLQECHPRNDYKEFLHLVLIFVGVLDGSVVGFRTPGATHHARWMAKAIYSLKIFMFRSQFKMSNEKRNALGDICVFIVKIYCKAWFNAPRAYLAP
ncbi:uncharacterized protein LOC129906492 [Episyrphus balteatus]|uniref:uncharacterized protein LOC129906492 n=1 Tax=Episyrphus balteatus TaxID=286459 RepID=UPI0024861A1A|nr:uncharacterized protein LOC129906492 [Episyrphus balteatus]